MSTQDTPYGSKPSAVINPMAHEVAPMSNDNTYKCTDCDEIFYTLEAADKHEREFTKTHR